MDETCLIKTTDPQLFSNLCNDLENGTILGYSTNMYHKTIVKAYDVICKYKAPENSTDLSCNRAAVSLHKRGDGNQTSPPIAGTDYFLHNYFICYNCDRPDH